MGSRLALVGAAAVLSRAQIIDEYGELDRQVQQLKPKLDRYEELKKLIKGWYDEHGAAETAIAVGNRYEIQVSARENVSQVRDVQAVYKAIGGLSKFLQFVRKLITKAALADALRSEAKAETFFVKAQTGSRRLKAVARAPAGLRPAA